MITTIHRGVARVGDILQVVINEAGVLRASVEILDDTLTFQSHIGAIRIAV